ncbi:MAG: DNA primase small subunit domain-containing protein, partial [Nanoarchaeota archaeon]
MPIDISTSLKYYKQTEVQEAIVKNAEGKEIGVLFQGQFFGKRPETLKYPKDVLEFAKNGASSFHCSEETWNNPLQLNSNLKRTELDDLRSGWDLIIDIDSKILDYSKIAADLVVQALRYYDIDSLSTKFSGNHGFHLAVPFEAFPETVNEQKVKNLFPEGPRRIAAHLKRMILPFLTKTLLDKESIDEIMKKTGQKKEEIIVKGKFDPFSFVGIDTILISSRHLFRMPYSLNEKSGLVSVPIKPERILEFNKDEEADPKNVSFERNFMNRELAKPGEARKLFIQAFDET